MPDAFDRAVARLANIYNTVPTLVYALVFETVVVVLGCKATDLAQAVMAERARLVRA